MKQRLLKTISLSLIGITTMAQMPNMKINEVNNTKIAYYEKGKGETILLLHGWPQTSYVWRYIFPKLSEDYRVIAIDLPGMGKSEKTSDHDTKSISNIINEFTENLNIKNFHLVSHDVGSWVATSYALNFESKLKSLTVIDAGIPGLMSSDIFQPENANKIWQFYFHSIEEIPEFLIEGKEKEYLSWYFSRKSFVKSAISERDLMEYYDNYKGTDKMKNSFEYYRAFTKSAVQNREFSNKINIPVLAIGGEFAMAENVGNALNKIAINVQSKTIKNCGHYVPEEQPDIVVETFLNFIK